MLLWLWLKSTRFGAALYAIGSDADAARVRRRSRRSHAFLTYAIAGGCYGLAGVFISAQTGSGDPLVGNSMLLSIFAAVVLGGTRLGGGRGGPTGSVFGAYILMSVVNVLLVLNVSAYYSTIAEGVILILAVLAGLAERRFRTCAAAAPYGRRASPPGAPARSAPNRRRRPAPARSTSRTAARSSATERRRSGRGTRDALRYAVPAYVCFVAVVVVTELWLGSAVLHWSYWNSLIVLSSFLAILALGQGTVILTGGLDLCVPWMIGLSGILLAGMVQGSDKALDLRVAGRVRDRRDRRLRQWRRHRGARNFAHRHDARDQRRAAGRGVALFRTELRPDSPRRCCDGS